MKKVLLIEDDPILRENTAELLELASYEVVTAANGKLGVTAAKTHLPDIVVCDIMMPELDGYGVLQQLSENDQTKYIPFIFLSAKTERKDVRKGMNLGADDYITKPFEEDELMSAIESRMAKAAILRDEREANLQQLLKNDDNNELRTLNDLKNFFDDNGQLFTYEKDAIIYEEGHPGNFMYLIVKGMVKCHKLDAQGKELTTALYKEDDLFGYTSFVELMPHQETATAIQYTEIMALSRGELTAILTKNHQVTLELIQLLSTHISGIKEQLLEMAYGSVYRKTARTILKFAEKLNRKPEDPIRISRHDLASVAGIATETLIRSLSRFKKEGIIEIHGRTITIIDYQRLREMD